MPHNITCSKNVLNLKTYHEKVLPFLNLMMSIPNKDVNLNTIINYSKQSNQAFP